MYYVHEYHTGAGMIIVNTRCYILMEPGGTQFFWAPGHAAISIHVAMVMLKMAYISLRSGVFFQRERI